MLITILLGDPVGDPVLVKAIYRFDEHWTKSQLLIDKTAPHRYLVRNRALHASQRCAPGGTFFARSASNVVRA